MSLRAFLFVLLCVASARGSSSMGCNDAEEVCTDEGIAARGGAFIQSQRHLRTGLAGEHAEFCLFFDAGSGATRLYIYQLVGHEVKQIQVSEEDEKVLEGGEALASFFDAPEQAGPALTPLLTTAATYVPPQSQPSTQVWLRATAGVRLLPIEKSKAVLEALSNHWSENHTHPFLFMDAGMASGDMEAVYESLTVNALKSAHGVNVTDFEGVLGLGGASVQIAFKPEVPIRDSEMVLNVWGQKLSIYAKSFMRFGVSEARDRALVALAREFPHSNVIGHPCMLRGVEESTTLEGRSLTFQGLGDAAACSAMTKLLLHEEVECMMPPCSMMGVYTPRLSGSFIAYSVLFYVANELNLVGWSEAKVLMPSQLFQATGVFCGLNASEAQSFNKYAPWKYLKEDCFNGHYVFWMLRAFGFALDDTSVTYMRKYEGETISWTKGAVLYHALQ